MKQLTLKYTINKPLSEVYPHFSDLRKFGKLHPYMINIEEIKPGKFRIYEKLKLYGFIPMKPVYTSEVSEPEKNKHLLYTAHVKKGVDLKIHLRFMENEKRTAVTLTETIEVYSYGLIASMFLSLIKKAHQKLVENLINSTKK